MKIAIASGKGGTGKTTIALALAQAAIGKTALLDCDVEAPNCHLFSCSDGVCEPVTVPMPVFDKKLCNGCGECAAFCQFNAVAVVGKNILLFPELCHGCGGCVKVCPTGALTESSREIGETKVAMCSDFVLIDGHLNIGQAMSPPVIRAVKERGAKNVPDLAVIDCPPGTSCPMVTAVRGADFVLLVTEPTPFGLNDLILAVETLKKLELPFGVIINRADSGDDKVKEYCRDEKIPVMLEIANRRDIAEAYSRGETLLTAAPELRGQMIMLLEKIDELIRVRTAK